MATNKQRLIRYCTLYTSKELRELQNLAIAEYKQGIDKEDNLYVIKSVDAINDIKTILD